MLMRPHTGDLTAFCLNPCIGIGLMINALCVLFLRLQSVLQCAWVWWCVWLAVLLPFWHFGLPFGYVAAVLFYGLTKILRAPKIGLRQNRPSKYGLAMCFNCLGGVMVRSAQYGGG